MNPCDKLYLDSREYLQKISYSQYFEEYPIYHYL